MSVIHQHTFPNGLHLLAEPVHGAQSLAMTLQMPAGSSHEPVDKLGMGAILSELVMRGAGGRNAREHSEALDGLGVQRSCGNDVHHIRLSATMLGHHLPAAFGLLMDVVRAPMLPASAVEPVRELALSDLAGLEDEPQQKTFVELRKQHYFSPFNRPSIGVKEHLEAITLAQLKEYWKKTFVPGGSVLAFAGKFDWKELKELTEKQLGNWAGSAVEVKPTGSPKRGYHHVTVPSTQVHIGLAYDAPPESDKAAMVQRAAVAVLSGGMSGRLFMQVREKRGLCYSVYARYGSDRFRGSVLAYAGTSTPRAKETLEVLSEELRKLSNGVEKGEFERAIVGMKSALVMQGESTGARAGAIASDQFVLGRARTLEELGAQVDGVTLAQVNEFVAANPPGEMTVVTIGPEALR